MAVDFAIKRSLVRPCETPLGRSAMTMSRDPPLFAQAPARANQSWIDCGSPPAQESSPMF
jgi:hypothetical protein